MYAFTLWKYTTNMQSKWNVLMKYAKRKNESKHINVFLCKVHEFTDVHFFFIPRKKHTKN